MILIYIPTNSVNNVYFLIPLPLFYFIKVFEFLQIWLGEMTSHKSFNSLILEYSSCKMEHTQEFIS